MHLFRTGLSLYPRQKGAAGLLVAFGTVIKVKKGSLRMGSGCGQRAFDVCWLGKPLPRTCCHASSTASAYYVRVTTTVMIRLAHIIVRLQQNIQHDQVQVRRR